MKKYLLITVLAMLGALFAVPSVAFAHHPVLDGDGVCADDETWSVTFSVGNSENTNDDWSSFDETGADGGPILDGKAMKILAVSTSAGSLSGVAVNQVIPNAGTDSTGNTITGIPNSTNSITLSVTGRWRWYQHRDTTNNSGVADVQIGSFWYDDLHATNESGSIQINRPTGGCHDHGTASVDGEVSCVGPNGGFSVEWTFTNNSDHHTMDITNTELTDGGVGADPTFSDESNIAAGGSVTATTNYASGAGVSNSIELDVTYGIDDDGSSATFVASATVTKPTTPCVVDVCPNLEGVQTTVPAGYVVDGQGNCVIDVCLNLEGIQLTVPEGYVLDGQGNCVIDVCLNLDGIQLTIPEGYVLDDEDNCVIDICENLEGIQVTVPEGYVLDNEGNCVIDVCENLEGIQVTVPEGYVLEEGECVEPESSITIVKDTNPETDGIEFDFSGSLASFSLEDDESQTFDRDPGTYTVSEDLFGDWVLDNIFCSGGSDVDIDEGDASVTIHLQAGEHVTCTFVNDPDDDECCEPGPTPTPSPSPSPSPTVTTLVSEVSPAVAEVLPARLPATGNGASTHSTLLTVAVVLFAAAGSVLLVTRLRREER